jgi:hypothetical protein
MEWTNYVYGDGTPYVTLTLYFRDETNQIVQTSVNGPSQLASGAYHYIPSSGATILGTPSAVFGGGLESGIRTVVVQGYTADTPVAERSASYLFSEDLCGGGRFCATSP